MKVILRTNLATTFKSFREAGDEIEVCDEEGARLIERGIAEAVSEEVRMTEPPSNRMKRPATNRKHPA